MLNKFRVLFIAEQWVAHDEESLDIMMKRGHFLESGCLGGSYLVGKKEKAEEQYGVGCVMNKEYKIR